MRLKPIHVILLCSLFIKCRKADPTSIPLDNYWKTEDPAKHAVNAQSMDSVIDLALQLPNFYALLVIRNNRLIAEQYFGGKGPNDLLHLRSITKNFTSSLTHIAIKQGIFNSVNDTIGPYFPQLLNTSKSSIAISHLLNMTSGLQWDESREVVPLLEHQLSNPVHAVIGRNLVTDPGSVFNYNTVSPHIITYILSSKSGMTLETFAEENLFNVLDVQDFAWEKDSEELALGGAGLQLTARDLAKFGQLFLNSGSWDGREIIDESWVLNCQISQIATPNAETGYSWHWWVSENFPTKLYFGNGYGGQGLMLLPEKNMMIIGLQEHLVSTEQNRIQWNNFLQKVFTPIYQAIED